MMVGMKVLFPGKILAPYIEAYYVSSHLRQDTANAHFPAGSTGYIKFSRTSTIVAGQATRPTTADASPGEMNGLGVKLRLGAFPALFGIPAGEVTDRVILLEDVLGNTADELNEQIVEAPTSSVQIQCFERIFARFVQRHKDSSHSIEQQALVLLRQFSTAQVSKLAERLGYSPRHLRRRLNDFVGFSPRLYKRISRFERALESIHISSRREKIDWSALAAACGYSDQAHFIREFRQFAGQTPAVYFASLRGS